MKPSRFAFAAVLAVSIGTAALAQNSKQSDPQFSAEEVTEFCEHKFPVRRGDRKSPNLAPRAVCQLQPERYEEEMKAWKRGRHIWDDRHQIG